MFFLFSFVVNLFFNFIFYALIRGVCVLSCVMYDVSCVVHDVWCKVCGASCALSCTVSCWVACTIALVA